ncbi:hypothetical protein CBM2623_A60079 [Cupriavidus taiwanensis]|nr:hypothetical protein CBM2608_A50116 [Cupriavidus taiwanensis]SPA29763.1 hypothetical protein CBM2623_A60079 [Cupriavidus taiwanensis]
MRRSGHVDRQIMAINAAKPEILSGTREQRHDRVALDDAGEGLGQQRRGRELADLGALGGFLGQRDGVAHHHFVQRRIGDAGRRAARQHGVRAVGEHLQRATLLQYLGGLAQRAAGVDHVIHDDAVAAFDFTDDVHHLGHVGLGTTLVDDGQVAVQFLGQRAGTYHAADVRRDHQQVAVVLLAQVAQQYRRSVDVVDGNIEKALDLVGVQVHRQHALDAGDFQHVGHHLGRDRHARRTRAAVLAGIAEVGHGGGDAACRGALERIDHHHQFHQVVVGRRAGGLQHDDVLAANIFLDFDLYFTVGETANLSLAQRNAEVLYDSLREFGVGVAGKYHQAFAAHSGHLSCCWGSLVSPAKPVTWRYRVPLGHYRK